MSEQETLEKGGSRFFSFLVAALIMIVLVFVTNLLSKEVHKALEYPIWAVALGLVVNLLLSTLKLKEKLASSRAWRTELFIKIGLVLLGVSVNFTAVLVVGIKGIIQALIMVTSVFLFTWWLAGMFKLKDELRAVMAAAISICGVSAAIAAAGSVLAKREELTYVVALVIITALPLMVIMPYAAQWMGLPVQVAGAWFGGNIDTTAAVVGAGAIHSEGAMKIASIVKMSQNALIGVVAFILALYWVVKIERKKEPKAPKPSARIIWERFPKFVLGFLVASILVSLGLFDKSTIKVIEAFRSWAFALAFVCIGLELNFTEFKKMGGSPTTVYIIATVFNTLLALLVAWAIFGGLLGI